MPLLATLALTLLALLSFALAMARHQRQLLGRSLSPGAVRALRLAGWGLLVAAPLPWMAVHGAWMAFVAWVFCGVPVVGLAVVAVCSFLPGIKPAPPESSAVR